jgi:hypothetical protein
MSTKTTFKRIALVAVASMGFGVLTSVSVGVPAGDSTTAKTVGANATDLTITKRTLTADNGNVYGQACRYCC